MGNIYPFPPTQTSNCSGAVARTKATIVSSLQFALRRMTQSTEELAVWTERLRRLNGSRHTSKHSDSSGTTDC
jgi:hypothetical protein